VAVQTVIERPRCHFVAMVGLPAGCAAVVPAPLEQPTIVAAGQRQLSHGPPPPPFSPSYRASAKAAVLSTGRQASWATSAPPPRCPADRSPAGRT
jgi:hypothetical protein